ncbi:MAG TPA: aminotransferase class V-fold PLP-dependent enzyme [Aliidongia sp.]|nr:aminotransferase class V-fold PLP-dependent enzyme [Aliidongia sp.]
MTAPVRIEPSDENRWAEIRKNFEVASGYINLENGYFGIQPAPVLAAFQRYTAQVNAETSHFLRLRFPTLLEEVMAALAAFTGAAADELVLTRNATESMNIIAQGYPFQPGDNVLLGAHDYDHVVPIFEQIAERKGITLTRLVMPLHPRDDDEIVQLYERAIGPRTKVILATHMIHLTGQIIPVAKISKMAKGYGVDVMVDAAHSFAHVEFKLPDLASDFAAVNLHKWLGAPLGVGLAYIKRERIGEIEPLFADSVFPKGDIRRLAHFGTTPPATILAIRDAIDFHNGIGGANKEARLRYLKNHWMERVRDFGQIELLTPLDPARSCGIGAFRVKGLSSEAVYDYLWDEHKIFTVARNVDDGPAVRVTPHLYNTVEDLDRLVEALGRYR